LAQLFRSCPFLDVHLAIVEQHIPPSSEYDDCEDEEDERSFEIDHCINSDNTLIDLQGFGIDYQSQMVGDTSKLLSPTGSPFKQEEEYTGNEGMQVERWYHQAILFIWPKCHTKQIYLQYNFGEMLFQLEKRVLYSPPDATTTSNCPTEKNFIVSFQEMLDFLRNKPSSAFKSESADEDNKVSRLMKICIHLGAKTEGLALLNLLGRNGGIQSNLVAKAIATKLQIGRASCRERV